MFDTKVALAYEDDEFLTEIVRFLMRYCIYALPKESSNKAMKDAQVEMYYENCNDEINNKFSSYIELMTKSDMVWCCWQFINSWEDWSMKKKNAGKKNGLKSRFTGDSSHRHQPAVGSVGHKLYKKILKWFEEFRLHDDFKTKARVKSNEFAKKWKLLPTFTEEVGPRRTIKRVECDEDEPDDAPGIESDDEADDEILRNAGHGYDHIYNDEKEESSDELLED